MGEPRYPLTLAIQGGRVRHSARWFTDGLVITTLCRKRGPAEAGVGLPFCAACAKRPNPWPQQTTYRSDSEQRGAARRSVMSMTAEQWNDRHLVGTPVVAYPGVRPEDATSAYPAERLETATRSAAWTLGGHTPVVLVDGYAGGIALTHVDPEQ